MNPQILCTACGQANYHPACDNRRPPDGRPAVRIPVGALAAATGRGRRRYLPGRTGTSRLAYEHFLTGCDRAAAYLLNDENAARRAADLKRHTTAVGVLIARQQRRAARDAVICLAEQRARFVERRRRRSRGTDPA